MSIEATLEERSKTHGNFESHARICQSIKCQMFNAHGYVQLSAVQREALDMIAHKIARILNGNPNVIDNFRDIAGYATLVAHELESMDGSIDVVTTRVVRKNGGWVDGG